MKSEDYILVCDEKKQVEDGNFFRFKVYKNNGKEKALFWYTLNNNNNIYYVTAQFTDKKLSPISLYVKIKNDTATKTYYPSYAYMETSSLRMTAGECRDIIKCYEEASIICDIITDFFKTGRMES